MKLTMFVIFDQAVGQYANPMFFQSNGQAIRSFTDEVNREDVNNQLFRHPSDFTMHCVGSFESDTGKIDTQLPVLICRASDVAIRKE